MESPSLAARTDVLDQLLPLLQPLQKEMHHHAALLEVSDRAQLAEMAVNPRIRRFLLARLSDTVAVVDPGKADQLGKVLLAEGHLPRVNRGDDK